MIGLSGPSLDAFVKAAGDAVKGSAAQTMLTPGIHAAYQGGVGAVAANPRVREIARGQEGTGPHQCQAALLAASASDFLSDEALEGRLTATLQIDDGDLAAAQQLLPLFERKAGRVLANGWPTGVEVCQAMVHGGPFPATSDSRTTSVGSAAIQRFLRPVCYQNLPAGLLSEALQDDNPLNVSRLVDGQREL